MSAKSSSNPGVLPPLEFTFTAFRPPRNARELRQAFIAQAVANAQRKPRSTEPFVPVSSTFTPEN